MKKILLLSLLSMTSISNALTVDTMLKISDENGTGVFSLANDLNEPSFITVKPSKVIVSTDGEIKRIQYTKDNLQDWEISLTQNKIILDPKRTKNVGVRSLCADGCDRSKDTVFALKFLPSPYVKDGQKKAAVSINYGYEPLFVIPAEKPSYKYNIDRVDSDKVIINNKSNSLLRVYINQCDLNNKKDCSKNVIVLSGRNKTVKLPIHARQDSLNLNIMGYDNSFYKKATLSTKYPIVRE
ncbi:hypothetical protein [Photobacterium damselae]|uniref:hypothetical protein n=1 Tax=Photobacterium damselae TaxID=38293 RepID=UPI0035A88F5F